MAKIEVRYLVEKPNADGTSRWYWQPSKSLRKLGWTSLRLKHEDGTPILERLEAADAAEALNRSLDAARGGAEDPERPKPLPRVPALSVAHAIRLYKDTKRYQRLKPKTRAEYGYCLNKIEAWAGDQPVRGLTPLAIEAYYEGLADTPAMANAVLRVLRILLKSAKKHGLVAANAAQDVELIGTAPRLHLWPDEELEAYLVVADQGDPGRGLPPLPSIGDAVLLAYYSGQRQGDCLALKEAGFQSGRVQLKQSKRGKWISVPATPRLLARLEDANRRAEALLRARREALLARGRAREARALARETVILCELTARRWNQFTFRHYFARIRAAAAEGSNALGRPPCPSIAGSQFLDLRDTAVTRLAKAGCTIPEICAITGHSERTCYEILKHYLALDSEIADNAIAKLVAWEEAKAAERD